jgi:hypothetical protein
MLSRRRSIWPSQVRFFAEFTLEQSEGLRMTVHKAGETFKLNS